MCGSHRTVTGDAMASQLIAPSIAALTQQIAELNSAVTAGPTANPETASRKIIESQNSVLTIINGLAAATVAIESALSAITASSAPRGGGNRKPMCESRCVSNLKVLGSD